MMKESDSEVKANLHLIAAAPDLLEACKLVMETLIELRAGKPCAGSSLEQQAKILNRAIAKAEGVR